MTHYYSDAVSELVTTATTDKFIAAPTWASAVSFDAPTDFEWAFAAKVRHISVYDASTGLYSSAEEGNLLDTESAGVLTLDAFEGAADFLYIGAATRFKSISFTMGAANATGSVGTLKYWNGTAWADIAETDGTISAGNTLGQTGVMTFTIPAAWDSIENTDGLSDLANGTFYVRWEAATTLDAEVEVSKIVLGSRTTGYVDVNDGAGVLQNTIIPFDTSKVGGVVVKAAAGTPVLSTTWYGRK